MLCNSCDQMKKENAVIRKALMETNKQYVDVCNEVLELKRQIEVLNARKSAEAKDNN